MNLEICKNLIKIGKTKLKLGDSMKLDWDGKSEELSSSISN